MTELNLETRMETMRRERSEAILKEYREDGLKLIAKGNSPYRVMSALAAKHQMSVPGVRMILERGGEYVSSAQVKEHAKSIYPTA